MGGDVDEQLYNVGALPENTDRGTLGSTNPIVTIG